MGRRIAPVVLLVCAAAAAPAAADVHVVQAEETLGGIARKYGCTLAELREANPDAGDLLSIGQRLDLPRGCRVTYTVAAGDTLTTIARAHGCTLTELREANPDAGDLLGVGQHLDLPGPCVAGGGARPGEKERAETGETARSVPRGTIDGQQLPTLMARHGFSNPGRFKALVVDITLELGGKSIARENWFDYRGSARVVDDWNPASTVKLYSAIGALQFVKSRGFDSCATATFHDPGGERHSHLLSDLIADAIEHSDNIAHNRLVQLAGHRYLNGRVLDGLQRTAIHKAYSQAAWKELTGGDEWLRNSPRIDLRRGGRRATIQPRKGGSDFACPGSSACSTLFDLATVMRRFMLHEQLPPRERYDLSARELRVLRQSLRARRRQRGMGVVSALESAFEPGEVLAYHKPGFSGDWMSDVVYLLRRRSSKRWIVVVGAHPGRDSVIGGARAIGRILAAGELE